MDNGYIHIKINMNQNDLIKYLKIKQRLCSLKN